MKLLPLVVYVVLVCYLVVPVYAALWIRRQRSATRDLTWGIAYLCIWGASLIMLSYYVLTGSWYRENTPLLDNVVGALVMLGLFVALPIVCFYTCVASRQNRHEA